MLTQQEESIKYVIEFERKRTHGRTAVDVSKGLKGYDIKSGDRYIEVKSRYGTNIHPSISLYNALLRTLGKGLAHYYIYIVYDMKRDPKLVIVPPEIIFKNLKTDVSLSLQGKAYNKIKPIKLK